MYVSRVLLESIPDFVPWTTATGWQVMRIDWSAPSDVVKSSPGETSESSDYGRERGEGRRGEEEVGVKEGEKEKESENKEEEEGEKEEEEGDLTFEEFKRRKMMEQEATQQVEGEGVGWRGGRGGRGGEEERYILEEEGKERRGEKKRKKVRLRGNGTLFHLTQSQLRVSGLARQRTTMPLWTVEPKSSPPINRPR